jgi:glycosyltransferase involved in cell wall biosynthesis
MPVFNAEAFLDDAVASIRAQTFSDFRLILLDDGSTDGSADILRRHARADARLTLISRPNRGLVASLNEMIDLARPSPLLARMDADDIALPDRFRIQSEFLDAHPEAVCIGGAVELITRSGATLVCPPPYLGNETIQAEALSGRTPICHPAVMMRAEALARVGGYRSDAYPAEDLDLFLRLGEIGQLDNVPEVVLRYRVHDDSVSVRQSERQRHKMIEACRAAARRRELCDTDEQPLPAAELDLKPGCPISVNPTAAALAGHRLGPFG